MNPWGLTPKQVQVMDAIIQHGCNKRAANALCMGLKTLEAHASQARARMGLPYERLHALLRFDRWRFGCGAERAVGDPCTCSTPSGPRHCPEHADGLAVLAVAGPYAAKSYGRPL
jgi:hypothetical protein